MCKTSVDPSPLHNLKTRQRFPGIENLGGKDFGSRYGEFE